MAIGTPPGLYPSGTSRPRPFATLWDAPRSPNPYKHLIGNLSFSCGFGEGEYHWSVLAAICEPEQACSDNNQNAAINNPLGVTGHETAGQDIDALQEENNAREDQQYTYDIQNDLHKSLQ
jgi:hypothetical protein